MNLPSIWSYEDDWDLVQPTATSGLTISEDEKFVYVSASLPGIDPKDVEVTFDRGTVWIKGESAEEEKQKKYYRKASSSFSYRVAVPGDLDLTQEPEASSKHGVMTVKFTKSPEAQPKKIVVRTEK